MKRFQIIKNVFLLLLIMIFAPLLWVGFWMYDRKNIDPLSECYAEMWGDIKREFIGWQ